uniref:Topoisomerase IV subunit A n=1 Tax=uncultured bacterium contig00113 TaxID=1181576 RepID=A0A806K2F7_9BACT|nr:topoisomerase IV subunit A [uncultured bacterium contig00113]
MAYIKNLFDRNFLEYASYVIKDRAIPDLEDGLKPVQRRILHSLFEMDDGKFHKVANVTGHCMKYHPHGEQSINPALVVLANKDLFIDRQGNFGNLYTGDDASAPRYIECRVTPFAKDIFYNPKLTEWADSYDGRNREPVLFPAKIPVVLVMGVEGIAVGMSTKILSHNAIEVLEAEIACLSGKKFELYPDFPTGGYVDVSEYNDGNGKVLVRAKLDTSDPKRILITELPFGSTTESLINSVEAAARAGRLKIQSISDFTTDKVEIEVKLARGVYAQETVDALFAFTECEQSISTNLLVIKNGLPAVMTVTEIIKYHAKQLVKILTKELELEKKELLDKLHQRTLERIFIEERIYKGIEKMKTAKGVQDAVIAGFKPFLKEIGQRGVSEDDVEHLLKIPIRRISLYDINKAKDEMLQIEARIKEINGYLKNITAYSISCLKGFIAKIRANEEIGRGVRKTVVGTFDKVIAKEVVKRDVELKYDSKTGYLGTNVSGVKVCEVSPFDRILVIRKNAMYTVMELPEKTFVGADAWHICAADKEELSNTIFTVIYKDKDNGYPCIKRFIIEGWIIGKDYFLVPDGAQVLHVDTRQKFTFSVKYAPKPRLKVLLEEFKAQDYNVRGLKAGGIRLAAKEAAKVDAGAGKGQKDGE